MCDAKDARSIVKKTRPTSIIVAVDLEGGFGKDGKIPWNIPEDMKHFKEVTKGGVCVMGRRTYQDMLDMRKDRSDKKIKNILPGRESYVVTSNTDFEAPGATVVPSLSSVTHALVDQKDKRTVFVLGGYRMYVEAIAFAQHIHMTVIKDTFDCDRFFPVDKINSKYAISHGEETEKLYFITYTRKMR